ncbi:hypothetical protein [Streptomyces sp. NPDC058272]|uniref:hypothetical protein n=1 Tax=Streptomyces sp. NPDC058272 TaxID=3346415 RepID=UPI0036E066E4
MGDTGAEFFGDATQTHPWNADDRARPDDLAANLAKDQVRVVTPLSRVGVT